MKPRNHVLLATVFLVATTAFGAEPDGPWSGKLGRGWRVFVGNSQGLGDKGLRVPVDALKHGGASAQTPDGTTVAYRFFFQRNSQRPDAKDYEPIIFNIWLQRLEANVVANEELVARWVSPLGTIVDENSRKNVLWSDDFADQASDLGIYADDLEPLRAQVYATLQSRAAFYAMFFPLDSLDFAKIPDPLEFSPAIESMLAIFRRLQLSDTLAEVEARDARIRGWLRKQSAATLARVPNLLLMDFAKLGTGFVPTEAHYTISDDAAALKRYMDTGRLPQSPRRDDGGALLAGAIVGGVGVGIAARLLALAGVTAQMDPNTYGLGSAAAGLTVASAINVLRTRFPRLVPANSSGLAIGATVAVGAVWGCAEAIVQWLAR